MAEIRDTLRLDIDQALRQVRELENALNRALGQIVINLDTRQAVRSADRLNDELSEGQKFVKNSQDAMRRFTSDLKRADTAAERLDKEMRDVARSADKAADQTRRIGREAKKATGQFKDLGKAAKKGLSPKELGLTALAGFGIREVVRGLGSLVSAASEGVESINAVNVVFGEASESILAFGKNTEDAVFLASTEFNKLATVTGTLLQGFNLDAQTAAELTIALTERAADLASVFDTEVAVAMEAINAALRGETEQIRKFTGSFSIDEVTRFGREIFGVTGTLTDQQKALAAVEFIMKKTAATQGDAAATAGEFANQQRKLNELWGNAQDELGQALIPAIESLLPVMFELVETSTDLVPLMETLAPVVAAAAQEFIDMFDPLLGIVNLLGLLPGVSDGTEDSLDAVGVAATGMRLAWQSTVTFLRGPVGIAGDFVVGKLVDMRRATDDTASSIVDLTKVAGVYSGAQGLLNSEIEDAARAVAAQASAYDDLFRASQPVVTATGDLSGAQALLNDEVANALGPFDRYASTLEAILNPTEELKEELSFVDEAFAEAAEAVDTFRTATLKLADPVFAAVAAQSDLLDTIADLADLEKDPDATLQAIIDATFELAEKTLEADAAARALGDITLIGGPFDRSIGVIGTALGFTRQEVLGLLEDGLVLRATDFGFEIAVTVDDSELERLLAAIPERVSILTAFDVSALPSSITSGSRVGVPEGSSGGFVFAPTIIHPTTPDLAGDLQQGANLVATIPGLVNRVR